MKKRKTISTYFSASKFHRKSEELREEDRHIGALKIIEEAIVAYQKEKNYEGMSRALQSRFLIYKHLFLLSRDKAFAILGEKDAQSSLLIAKEHNISAVMSSCYFRLGEAAMLFEDYKKARDNYKKAIDTYVGTKAEKGDYRYHLGEAIYKNGEKETGKRIILQGLTEIKNNAKEADSFLIHVWESGCYMRLAELLRDDEPDQAKYYLNKAHQTAISDNRLIIRKRQIDQLANKFSS